MAKRPGFPSHQYTNGVGIGQLEMQTGWPASSIKQWIEDGVLVTNYNGTISNAEVARFRRERANPLPDDLDLAVAEQLRGRARCMPSPRA